MSSTLPKCCVWDPEVVGVFQIWLSMPVSGVLASELAEVASMMHIVIPIVLMGFLYAEVYHFASFGEWKLMQSDGRRWSVFPLKLGDKPVTSTRDVFVVVKL